MGGVLCAQCTCEQKSNRGRVCVCVCVCVCTVMPQTHRCLLFLVDRYLRSPVDLRAMPPHGHIDTSVRTT